MSLKKKKIKKRKRNNVVEVLKNSLSKADEVNKILLKQLTKMDEQKSELESVRTYLMGELNKTRTDAYALQRHVDDLKERLHLRGERRSVERLAKKSSILIVDDMVKKSYEPSELVDPGDYVEIDGDGKIVKRIDSNNLILPSKESSKSLGKLKDSLGIAAVTVNKFGEVIQDGKKVKIEELKGEFKSRKIIWGNEQFDVEGSKKVSKENDPYELLNKEYLNNCIDVPDGENYKDGYINKFGRFIKKLGH